MGDFPPGLACHQAVSLGIVDIIAYDGIEKGGQILRVHLIVARHHDRDVDVMLAAPDISRADRRANSAVSLVTEREHTGVDSLGFPDYFLRSVGAGVVHDNDVIDVIRYRFDRAGYKKLFVMSRNDDAHSFVFVHDGSVNGNRGGQ